jgi:hypothetical protein
MHSLPREIHQEIIGWLGPEFQQITRLTNRYFAGLIKPRDVNLLIFGAMYGVLEYCEIGLSRGNSKMQVCNMAAHRGRLDVLEWVRFQGCLWNEDTCAWAAMSNRLEVLKWARGVFASERNENTVCPWNGQTCSLAAVYGHLEVLRWAIDNGCPWDFRTVNISQYPQHIQDYLTTLRG